MTLLRKPFVELSYALRASYRRRRFDYFWQKVGRHVESGFWLDVGSGADNYFLSQLPDKDRLIVVDVDEQFLRVAKARYPFVNCVLADGQHLPFRDAALACIFCNSVIEHVPDPAALAIEIRRTSRRFFVQTPNGQFPLETHSAIPIPLYQFLPGNVRKFICGLLGSSFQYVSSVTYLSEADLRRFFPSATIERERAFGLTKSYYVLGTTESDP